MTSAAFSPLETATACGGSGAGGGIGCGSFDDMEENLQLELQMERENTDDAAEFVSAAAATGHHVAPPGPSKPAHAISPPVRRSDSRASTSTNRRGGVGASIRSLFGRQRSQDSEDDPVETFLW